MMMFFFVPTHHILPYADILEFLQLLALNRVPRHNRRMDLLGDLSLTRAVHLEREIGDQIAGFSDALRIAVMRAPCSDAVDSSSARKIEIST